MANLFNQVCDDANAVLNKRNQGILYKYVILDKNFSETEKEGTCKNLKSYYNPCYDYNILSFEDITTGKRYSVCQFYVKLEKLKA